MGLDPTSISKKVKRNRIVVKSGSTSRQCDKLEKWPYVCSSCNLRYSHCSFNKYKYDARIAQNQAQANLITSRRGLDLDDEEFEIIDKIIKKGIEDKQSLYQIKIKNADTIHKSLTTLYSKISKIKIGNNINIIPPVAKKYISNYIEFFYTSYSPAFAKNIYYHFLFLTFYNLFTF